MWSDLFFALLVPLLPAIKEDLGLSFAEVGLLRSLFTGATAVLQIPAGILAKTLGEFWLLVLGNVWVSLGLMGMALSPVFPVLLAVSFLGGLGGGTQHPLGSSLVSRAYDDRSRSTVVGTVNFAGDIGKMLAPLLALIAIPFGWRAALWTVGLAGVLFMAINIPVRRLVDLGRPAERRSEGLSTDSTGGGAMSGFALLSVVEFLDSATRAGGRRWCFCPLLWTLKAWAQDR